MTGLKDIFSLPQTHQQGKSKLNISDKLIIKIFHQFIPRKVRPNHLTVIRFFLIPFTIFFLLAGRLEIGVWFFAVGVFTDALDGAIARYRHQITAWGKFYDPMADKLLIGSTALIVVWKYLNPFLAIGIILFEIIIVGIYWIRTRGTNTIPQAKWAGKIKMIIQSVAILLLIISVLIGAPALGIVSGWMIGVSFIFAGISVFTYNSI